VSADRIRKVPWVLRYKEGARLASWVRQLTVRATHRHCNVEFRGPVRLGPGFSLHIPDHGTLIVGSGVDFRRGFVCEISDEGVVQVGDGSIFTSHALIQCTTSIDIGRRCVFGQDVMIVDGRHRFGDPELHLLEQGYDYQPLRIGDNAVVMSKCTLMADIGEGTVVGAHSLVTRPLPAHCIAFGSPAKPRDYFRSTMSPEPMMATEG
jgi:acetyltransferase-like isoleucine patch superfamily enzyme